MNNNWFTIPKPNPMAVQRLFCFPYAGGSTPIYRKWVNQLPSEVELCLIQLPGRDRRITEPLFTDIMALAEAIAQAIMTYSDKPFGFLGHSLGATTCFEVACALRRYKAQEPTRLLVSGSRAPHMPRIVPSIYHLPETEFIAALKRLGGTPAEVWQYPELIAMFMPILRADLTMSETYQATPAVMPALDCPITVFGGTQDPRTNDENLQAWQELTSAQFTLYMVSGGHFFPWDDPAPFLARLSAVLRN
ncbi:thioesterase domain-containing protein [Anaerolineales bacterium HSG25]|nr:thioesterase domain-containing protein [Anaerolineales bacterium HSG25]